MGADGSNISKGNHRIKSEITEIDLIQMSNDLFGVSPWEVYNHWTFSFWVQMLKSKEKSVKLSQKENEPKKQNNINDINKMKNFLLNTKGVIIG